MVPDMPSGRATFRLLDVNDVVSMVLDRLETVDGGPLRRRLDARLPRVIGDPVLLACAVASLVRHGGRELAGRGRPLVVETERLPSVVRGEYVARIRVAVDDAAGPRRAPREVRPGPGPRGTWPPDVDPELALAARIAGDHGGVVLGTAERHVVLDLPSVAA